MHAQPDTRRPSALRKVIASAAMGQFVEWYDFVIYAYSAAIIAKLFFPNDDPVASVLSVFGVYAVGFLMRPLGGIFFGLIGDRIGRRRLLVIVILTMGLATMAIGVLPTYAQVGVLAPILLVACRMVQGFSAAGETVGSNAFVAEHAPPRRRGLYVSFTYSFSTVPSVVAALFVLLLTTVLPAETYESWGWRIAFLAGGPMALIGLYIRTKVDESPVFEAAQAAKKARAATGAGTRTSTRSSVARVLALAALSSLAFYTLSGYFVTFLTTGANLPSGDALLSNGIALVFAFVSFWVGGALSDRFGRRPVLIGAIIATIVLYLPALSLAGVGTFWAALGGQIVIALVFGVYWGAFGITVIELFPTRNRLSGATISWNVAYTIFGGTAPLLSTWLIQQTGSLIAPGIYMISIAVIVLLIVWRMPETAGSDLLHADDRAPEELASA
ncbi:MFS transporter [Microbacterium sp.]|uniref:MFS transporter n=1 Tax=Microbacterium sp. TaxID=51671 RepID=UPI0039E28BE6